MQDRLTIKINDDIIPSKTFDMKAYRKVEDYKQNTNKLDILEIGEIVLYELFDGTKVTNEIIEKLDVVEMAYLCEKAFDLYFTTAKKIIDLKKQDSPLITVRVGE